MFKKIKNFIVETWKCYVSPNTLTYSEPNVVKVSDLTAIFIEYFCYGYMFTLFFVFIFTLITTMIVSGFSLQLFIFLMALIGFTITVFVTIKNKACEYYNKCIGYSKKVIKNVIETIKSEQKTTEQQTTATA